ncbi:hypothetical protein DSO57_1029974 [Entomophthora muscae]|uniref:Uncharacterized protein n=1 Tax=Entomophthora muscae TaxID=34485 RepID=A0ACC2TC87_9FUNG|nr:hypothetical protein DSO57_1029974 [Entomophthora muscae]
MVSHKSAPGDKVEPVYGTNYSVSYLTLQDVPAVGLYWDLQLPSENPFLGDGTEVMESDLENIYNTTISIPQRIIMDLSGEMWALPVDSAKSVLYISIALPQQIKLEDFVKVELYSSIKFESLGEMNYHLSKAGNYYSVEAKEDSLQVNIFGFNRNIPRIVDMILAALVDPWVGWEEFAMFKYSVSGLD